MFVRQRAGSEGRHDQRDRPEQVFDRHRLWVLHRRGGREEDEGPRCFGPPGRRVRKDDLCELTYVSRRDGTLLACVQRGVVELFRECLEDSKREGADGRETLIRLLLACGRGRGDGDVA